NWSYEFLTDKEEGLGLDPSRLYITVFDGSTSSPQEGDTNAPRDDEAREIWGEIFKKNNVEGERIFYMSASSNWWEAGDNGPCGPDTEMYYDVKNKFDGKGITKEEFIKADYARDVVEVWNDVFMQYEKKDGKIVGKLSKPSIDTGAGLERLAMTLQGVDNIYDTDLLKPIIKSIKGDSGEIKSERIVADHIKATVMMIADGITPSNTDRGYVLRKLIRRAVRHSDLLFNVNLPEVVKAVQDQYKGIYPNVIGKDDGLTIQKIIREEEKKFRETLKLGLKEFEKGVDAFTLFSSYGFPLELTLELAKEKGVIVDTEDFEEKFKKHQELSRAGAEKKFKGGLGDVNDEKVVQYHTATHLLHQALHDVLGENANQKGSNITAERLRFDFVHSSKMTQEEIKKVEEIVNEKIKQALPVSQVILGKEEAEKTGARHFFGEKYGDQISIYYIGDSLENAYSKEFCGGPHVKNTKELIGQFKIMKEEAVASGVRRIKAVLI
ncbi:MAG: alanine--tRNA ligase-related protein, partial [Candidatus Paceibacterota bacterium]